ncbi:hypothetical protein VZT92_011958 [Zoarces viviparus]|uniref:Secreted protein n=1 Tax=Zoarces viviparus TaxID=48416 RepID=A0AAW1F863_ZOAVI
MSRLPSRSLLLLDELSVVAPPRWSAHAPLKPNAELHEEATDKNKRQQRHYGIKNTITDVVGGSQGERLIHRTETRLRVALFGFIHREIHRLTVYVHGKPELQVTSLRPCVKK